MYMYMRDVHSELHTLYITSKDAIDVEMLCLLEACQVVGGKPFRAN